MRVSQIYIFHTTFHHSLAPLPLTAGHRQRDAPRASSPRRTLRSPSSRAESALALATAQSSVTHAERYGVSGCFLLHHTSSVTRNTPEELYTLQRDEANATPVTASRPDRGSLCLPCSPRARVVEAGAEVREQLGALYSLERRLRYSLERRLASSLSVSPTKALMPSAILVVAHTSALSASRKSASEIFPSPG